MEDFEQDPVSLRPLSVPYKSGNGFLINGNGYPEIINFPQLPMTGNMLHFRDWEQGTTLTFPEGQSVRAFGLDYTTPEEWVLTFGNFNIPLPAARNGFVGFVFYENFPLEFGLSSSADFQGGLLLDNIAYVPPYIPSTSTTTPTISPTPTPESETP